MPKSPASSILHFLTLLTLLFACEQAPPLAANTGFPLEEDPPKKEKTYVPGQMEFNGHVYLYAWINDTIAGSFIFDTGANSLIVDKAFALRHKLYSGPSNENTPPRYTYGVGEGRLKTEFVEDLSVTYGTEKIGVDRARLMALDSLFGEPFNHQIDGIIGADMFEDFLVHFDFANESMSLLDEGAPIELATYQKVKYRKEYNKFMLNIAYQVEKGEMDKAKMAFDMGAGSGLYFTHRKSLKDSLFSRFENLDCKESESAGIGGISRYCLGETPYLELAPNLQLSSISVELGQDKNGALGMQDMYDGMVGLEITSSFDLIIDQRNKALYFRKP